MHAQDDYDHLRESADAASEKYVLVDQINSQVFGPFSSRQEAEDAARTGADSVGGVPWGEEGWEVVSLQQINQDYEEEGLSPVILEITDEVESGNAHLLTCNELVEFVEWLVTDERSEGLAADHTINSVIYDYMNRGNWTSEHKAFATAAAKKFFIQKGYEK